MAELTHLYVLIFPKRGIIKIGKADEIHGRIQSLRRWWGDVDYEASYHLSARSDIVFSLEKALHFLLSKYSVTFDEGDGRTEFFSCDAQEIALKYIELFCSSGAVSDVLKKGVLLPPLLVTSKRRQGKHIRHQKKNTSLVACITQIAKQFGRINRLLIILLRKQTRLSYEYDIIKGHVYFRVLHADESSSKKYALMMQMFSFYIEDFYGCCVVNCCTVTCADGILQYNIRLFSDSQTRPWDSFFTYFSQQSELLLMRLPKRSSAATDEIPILDESKIFAEMMGKYENSVL
jgi:hypothetical protein